MLQYIGNKTNEETIVRCIAACRPIGRATSSPTIGHKQANIPNKTNEGFIESPNLNRHRQKIKTLFYGEITYAVPIAEPHMN